MNSERQRRPNVRLREIGDVSTCGFSQKTKENFGYKRFRNVLLNSKETQHNSFVVDLDEIDMTKSKLNIGTITRKCRVMKRRGHSTTGYGNAFSSVWSSKLSPQFSYGTIAKGKEACEYVRQQENFDGFWLEGAYYEHHDVSPVSGYASDEMKFQGDTVSTSVG
ncbi:unnamed protein product [Dovyalis caffra]|uniref:Uncharacterized protein n=1 Tax=Dovyalis caffra TaxID=77055 RepID=A0AAV1QR52_9ROSI|nr:unnamed protein product [Dovyalis caffra]